MDLVLLSFADKRMQRALRRLDKQARQMGVYTSRRLTTEDNLDASFMAVFSNRLKKQVRGFGYWCWKPQIIIQTLRDMHDGDVLNYMDAGCHLNPKGKRRLKEYVDMVQQADTGMLAFQAKAADDASLMSGRRYLDLRERKWCKGDLFDYYASRESATITDTQTIGATVIFIRKCERSSLLLREFAQVFREDWSLVDDSPSRSLNFPEFIEHRHDQSVFSILCKLHSVACASAYEYWCPAVNKCGPDWDALKNYPIHAKRDRGLSVFDRIVAKAYKKYHNVRRQH